MDIKYRETRSNQKLFMQLLESFLMEIGVRRHRGRKKNSSLTEWLGRHSQVYGGRKPLLHRRTSAPPSPQGNSSLLLFTHTLPLATSTSKCPAKTLEKTLSGWKGTSNSRCQELTSITSLRTIWWRHTVEILKSPEQRQMKQAMLQSSTLGQCHSHTLQHRAVTSCTYGKAFL